MFFRLGQTYSDETMDGRNINYVITEPKPNRWIEKQILK